MILNQVGGFFAGDASARWHRASFSVQPAIYASISLSGSCRETSSAARYTFLLLTRLGFIS
jgi:hypothetical protein